MSEVKHLELLGYNVLYIWKYFQERLHLWVFGS